MTPFFRNTLSFRSLCMSSCLYYVSLLTWQKSILEHYHDCWRKEHYGTTGNRCDLLAVTSSNLGAEPGAWDRSVRTKFIITKSAHLQYFCYCCCTLAVFPFSFTCIIFLRLCAFVKAVVSKPPRIGAGAHHGLLPVFVHITLNKMFARVLMRRKWLMLYCFLYLRVREVLHLQSHIQVKRGNQANDKRKREAFFRRVCNARKD